MMDLKQKCALLSEDKSLKNLYELTVDNGGIIAAEMMDKTGITSVAYSEFAQMADNCAALISKTLGTGGRIAISMETRKEWFPVFWGVIRSGNDALLLDAAFSDEMTRNLMREAGSSAIITQRKRELGGDIRTLPCEELFNAPHVDGYKPTYGSSVALCTSGTTGNSRVFVYNGEALVEQVLSSELVYDRNRRFIDDEPHRSLVFLPFHHVFGFIANLLWSGFLGFTNIYLQNRAPQTIIETACTLKPTLLVTVPLLANNLCSSLLKKIGKQNGFKRAAFKTLRGVSAAAQTIAPSAGIKLAQRWLFRAINKQLLGTELRCLILGGSHTPREHLRLLNELGYYTVCGFGMTETAITSFETDMSFRRRLSGSVGKPLSNVQYRIRPDSGMKRRGEMLISGRSIHTGRLADGKPLEPDTLDGGWFATGDVVRLDKNGRMFVEGRCKDVIINESGENVYPDELEDHFSTLEGVEQFTILGVKKPGKNQHYEDITLVMNVGEYYKDNEYLSALLSKVLELNARLTPIKRITRAIVTPERLPLVNGIKVKRLALKEQLEQKKLAYRDLSLSKKTVEAPAPQKEPEITDVRPTDLQMNEIKQKVRPLFAEAAEIPESELSDNAHFIDDLKGDSLQMLSVSLKVEELFSILIPVEEYGRCATVNDLSALIYDKLTGNTAFESKDRTPDEDVEPITRFEDTPEYQAFCKRQQALMADGGDNPYFVCHDSPLRDTSLMAGQEVLNFGSYNYVGMSGRKEVQEAAKAAIDKYGTSASGSRLLAGEKSLYKELEREIAEWKHAEDAVVCVGGHSTNVTFVGNFCGKNDLIVYDALAHNSIEQGCRLSQAVAKPFPHNDVAALESILRTQRKRFEKVLIVIEGAYSMDGDVANVPAFVKVKKEYGCFLMVDEAHSACVIGKTGGGVDEYFGLEPDDIDIKMGTLSKGLGTCGGYLAGRKCLIEYLRYNMPGFVFSVGISPALAAGTLCAVRLIRQNPAIMADMKRNIECFVSEAKKRKLDICLAGETAIIPVLVGGDEEAFALSNMLRKRGVFVPPAVYPAVPKNKARLRFCVISEHKPEQIVRALDILVETAREMGIELPKREYAGQ